MILSFRSSRYQGFGTRILRILIARHDRNIKKHLMAFLTDLINLSIATPGQSGQAGALLILVLLVLLVPMVLYTRSNARAEVRS